MYGLKYHYYLDFSICMSFHVKTYWLAHWFQIQALPDLAFENLKKDLKAVWDVDEFLMVLETAWDDLWSYCIPICREHIAELLTKRRFLNLLERRSRRTAELTNFLRRSLRSYSCSQCNRQVHEMITSRSALSKGDASAQSLAQ